MYANQLFPELLEHMLQRPNANRPNDYEIRCQYVLQRIYGIFLENNCTSAQFGLPEPNNIDSAIMLDEFYFPQNIGDDTDDPGRQQISIATDMYGKLNFEQKIVVGQVEEKLEKFMCLTKT